MMSSRFMAWPPSELIRVIRLGFVMASAIAPLDVRPMMRTTMELQRVGIDARDQGMRLGTGTSCVPCLTLLSYSVSRRVAKHI
jgi:hypothetical protein